MQKITIQINSHSIACQISAGEGPAILLIHGSSSSGRAFQRQLEGDLGLTYRLAAIDLPGHGESSPSANPQADYTLPGYARIIAGAAVQLGMEEGIFVGWSLGGHALLEACDRLPRAAGFVIFGAPPLGFPPAMGEAFLPNPAMGLAFKADLSQAEAEAFTASFFRKDTEIPPQFVADVLQANGQARQMAGISLAAGQYKDETKIVAGLTAPLAVFHGGQDQVVNSDYYASLEMPTLWRGMVQKIPNAGHAAQWEQPEYFDILLEAFIKTVVR